MVAAPYPPAVLLKMAELAGYAIVVSNNNGTAQLRFTKFLKGRPRGGGFPGFLGFYRLATVAYRSRHEPVMLGDWWDEDCFAQGNRVLTHLRWSEDRQCYEAVWWNATSIIKRAM